MQTDGGQGMHVQEWSLVIHTKPQCSAASLALKATHLTTIASAAVAVEALLILMSLIGLSCAFVWTLDIFWTTFIPRLMRPKMVCLLSNEGSGPNVMKN
mmetsp:Transcript_56666/g.132983  ORF Transcript_56666/g.132983 Transcript_56666/m.132983 type:complete len:99 (-) Transcript_56666:340-636(-)